MSTRPPVFVHLLPALIPPGSLKGGVAIVIDVLRATTMMVHALAAGADSIRPCLEVDEARKLAAGLPEGSTILAGERQGVPIEGFDFGNSPADCTPEVCSGKNVVFTTTNGTRAVLACLEADSVLIAAFVNRKATLDALAADVRPVHIVCSGTDGMISLEDTMLAGALAQELDIRAWDRAPAGAEPVLSTTAGQAPETTLANDSAEIAASLWRETEALVDEGYSLADALGEGRGGRRVIELGQGSDIGLAAKVDRFPFAVELLRDPLRIVPATGAAGPRLRLFGA